jgi:predicted phosphodiesterase
MSYVYEHFIPENIAPKGAKSIEVYNSKGEKICTIPLGRLAPVEKTKLYSFGLVSDIHVYKRGVAWVTWNPEEKFDNALSFFESKGCVFCAHCGDITQTGLYDEGDADNLRPEQFEVYKEICDKHTIPVYGICGNHESYVVPITSNPTELKYYTGTDLYYTITQGDDLFIFIGQPNGNKVMGDDAFQWLTENLEDNQDKRCFVFVHSYIEEDSGDAKDLRENSIFVSWGVSKTNAFMELLRQHENVILFHGHSHMKFKNQELDKTANYTEKNGFKSVHVPSLGRSRDVNLTAGTTPEDMSSSEGYIVDVYADCILLNGMNLINNEFVPVGVYKIEI